MKWRLVGDPTCGAVEALRGSVSICDQIRDRDGVGRTLSPETLVPMLWGRARADCLVGLAVTERVTHRGCGHDGQWWAARYFSAARCLLTIVPVTLEGSSTVITVDRGYAA